MEIKEIQNKEIWENLFKECEEKTFLQSWNWGEFQKMMGNKIWRFYIFKADRDPVSVALIIKIQAKRGTFLFVPHGLNINSKFKDQKSKLLEVLLNKLIEITKKENASFIRISPILEKNEENVKIFRDLGFKEAPIHIHPELTWESDITPSEEELLMKMRKTTRYLIKHAQKNKEIEIVQSNKLEGVEVFNKLYQETVDRHHFVPFSLDYLKDEFLAFSKENQIAIFLGKYKNEIVSSGIFIFWQGIGFYHHGASSLKYPKIPVSYLLQWEAIKEAKKRGCKIYNFWGIAPITSDFKPQNSDHPWAGLTLFKMGFGGYKKEYVKTQDFPISKKYWLTYFIEKLRKTKRGL
jgi:lipid II:glycine glycyltransferase (peptidoglycan interpeptide bridge formation enzyme)